MVGVPGRWGVASSSAAVVFVQHDLPLFCARPCGVIALSPFAIGYRLGDCLLPGSVMLYLRRHYKRIRSYSQCEYRNIFLFLALFFYLSYSLSSRRGETPMEDLPIFQERLLLARRRAGVSQGELAKRTAMYASDISKMERGRMLPTAPRLRRLAEALGVSADYLLGLTHDPPATSQGDNCKR